MIPAALSSLARLQAPVFSTALAGAPCITWPLPEKVARPAIPLRSPSLMAGRRSFGNRPLHKSEGAVQGLAASSRADAGSAASAKGHRDADEEPEVVPVPVIGDFVDAHVVREQGDHERNGEDDPVPETIQKPAGSSPTPAKGLGPAAHEDNNSVAPKTATRARQTCSLLRFAMSLTIRGDSPSSRGRVGKMCPALAPRRTAKACEIAGRETEVSDGP
jgi:hypothetical protein